MELTPFIALYRYKLELIKKVRNIKIIVKKVRTSITELQKLYRELIIDIKFILEKIIIY